MESLVRIPQGILGVFLTDLLRQVPVVRPTSVPTPPASQGLFTGCEGT